MAEDPTANVAEEGTEDETQQEENIIVEQPTPAPVEASTRKLISNFFKYYWKTIVVILTPILLIPIAVLDESKPKEFYCLYTVMVMAIFWVTEAVPVGLTAWIPIFAFPFLGILDSEDCIKQYLSETVFMFMGGLFLAAAVEYSGLHFRFALKFLMFTGCSHRRLTFGVFFATMFVSMWIVNAAATAMMAPIVTAILQTLEEGNMIRLYYDQETPGESSEKRPTRTTLCYFIGIAYAASIGGTGVLIGTGTNLVGRGLIETFFPEKHITFHGWMLVAIPPMLIDFVGIWLWLNFLYLGLIWKGGCDEEIRRQLENEEEKKRLEGAIKYIIERKYEELGPMSWHEISVAFVFALTVALWMMRSPEVIPGWADRILEAWELDKSFKIKDACPAYLSLLLLSILPANLNFLHALSKDPNKVPKEPSPALLPWSILQNRMPWSLMFLIGGGFAISRAGNASGMNVMIGDWLTALRDLSGFSIMMTSCLIATALTELCSNVAVLNIIGPVLAVMIQKLNLDGAYVLIPVTICCSFAFCLPVGTPPNAIVIGLCNISTKDMIIAGTFPNVWTYLVTGLCFEAFGRHLF